jgi:ligand-binding sensor domain-containing protein
LRAISTIRPFCVASVFTLAVVLSATFFLSPSFAAKFARFDETNGLPSSFITSLVERENSLWVGTWNGIAIFEGGRFKTYGLKEGLPEEHVTALAVADAKLWIAFAFPGIPGLASFDGKSFTTEKNIREFRPENVTALKGTPTCLWVGTWGRGACRIDFPGGDVKMYTSRDGLVDDYVTSIEMLDNRVFFGSKYKKGLCVFDGTSFSVFNEDNSGLINNNVYSVAADNERKSVWIGTWGGVNEFTAEGSWESHLALGRGKLIKSFARRVFVDPEGGVWIGTDNGLSFHDPSKKKWESFTILDGLPSGQVTSIAALGKDIWIGTDRGLARINRDSIF